MGKKSLPIIQSEKGLVSKIHKELKNKQKSGTARIQRSQLKNGVEKQAESSQRMKPTSLALRETQTTAALRFHPTPVRMAKIKLRDNVNFGCFVKIRCPLVCELMRVFNEIPLINLLVFMTTPYCSYHYSCSLG